MRLTHIAAGADGSDEGKDAVALAAGLASLTGAGLSLVNVFPTTLFPTPGTDDRATLRKQADESLERDRDELAPDAIIHSFADLSVSRALMQFAHETHVEMVVIGSSPDAPNGRARIGRRGRQLLHDMPFALVLAPRGSRTRKFEVGRIGLGDDGGPEANVARDVAIELCRAARATLVIKSVIDNSVPAFAGLAPEALPEYESGWEYERSKAQSELEQQAAQLDVPTEIISVLGDPGRELRSLSDDVDLIVAGSRRWGPIARVVTGGVGETLVADAGCPVVIVPRPAEESSAA
jgi:nucleotide-binding universal stress UspA family protein